MPDCHYVSSVLVVNKVEKLKSDIVLALCEVFYASLSFDGWTSRADHHYLAITTRYISNEWTLESFTLNSSELKNGHDAVGQAAHINDILATYPGLKEKTVAMVDWWLTIPALTL